MDIAELGFKIDTKDVKSATSELKTLRLESLTVSKATDLAGKGIKAGFVAAAAGAVAATAAIAAIYAKQSQLIDQNAKLARSLDTTYDSLTAMQLAARDTGLDGLEGSLTRLNRRLGAAEVGSGAAASAVQALNLDLKALSAMDVDERVATIADAIRDSGVSMQRAARFAQDLGFEQQQAAEFFMQGGDAIRAYRGEVDTLGLSLSDIDAVKVEMANDAFSRLGLVMDGVGKQLTVHLAPVVKAIGDLFFETAQEAGGVAPVVEGAVSKMVSALAFVMDAADGVRRVFSIVGDTIVIAFAGKQAVIQTFTSAIINGPFEAINTMIRGLNSLASYIGVTFDEIKPPQFARDMEVQARLSRQVVAEAVKNINQTLNKPLAGKAFKDLYDQAQASAQAAAELAVQGRRTSAAMGDLNGVMETTAETMEKAAGEAKGLSSELQSILDRALPGERAQREYNQRLGELNDALRDGVIGAEAYSAALQVIEQDFLSAGDEVEFFTDRAYAAADSADPFAIAWEQSVKSIDGIFRDVFRGAFDSFSDFADSLKSAFKNLLAELAYTAARNQIMISLGMGDSTGGGGGIMSAIGGLFGGGGGSGGGGGGFNLGSVVSFGRTIYSAITGGLGSMVGQVGGMLSQFGSAIGWQGLSSFGTGMAGNTLAAGVAGPTTAGAGGAMGAGATVGSMASSIGPWAVLMGMIQSGKLYDQGVRPSGSEMWDSAGSNALLQAGNVGATLQSYKFEALDSLLGGGKLAAIITGSTFHQALWSTINGIFSGGERFKRTVGSATGSYADGEYVSTGPSATWYPGERQFGDEMDATLDDLNNAFVTTIGALFDAFDVDSTIATTTRTRLRRTSGSMVGDFITEIDGQITNHFRQYSKNAKIGEAMEQFVDDIMGEYLADAIANSDLPAAIRGIFEGLTDKDEVQAALQFVATWQAGLAALREAAGENVITSMLNAPAGPTPGDVYRAHSDALLEMADEFEGTVTATQMLSQAMLDNRQIAADLAMMYLQANEAVSASLGGLAERIRQDLMTEEDLYEYRRAQAHELSDLIGTLTDPAAIAETAARIESIVGTMWGSLDEFQQGELGGEFLDYLDKTAQIAQDRLQQGLDQLEQDQESIGQAVITGIDAAAARMEQAAADSTLAAQLQLEAAQIIAAAAQQMADSRNGAEVNA